MVKLLETTNCRFQSHAGSIEASRPKAGYRFGGPGFNPTLVRLRPVRPTVKDVPEPGFNPTLVRLRRGSRAWQLFLLPHVSIPRWFD
mgnify:CR=1 FL=1